MNLRVSAQDAGWSVREAVWSFEERVLWRGGDAARDALDRADRRLSPVLQPLQTKVTWPIADAYRSRSAAARRALAGTAAAVAIAAAGAGTLAANHGGETAQ